MATIKSYTSLEQSHKLADILPIESADAFYIVGKKPVDIVSIYGSVTHQHLIEQMAYKRAIPCWSLASLLGVLSDGTDIVKEKADTENEKYMCTVGIKDDIICTFGNNPVDACVAMIERLHELKML